MKLKLIALAISLIASGIGYAHHNPDLYVRITGSDADVIRLAADRHAERAELLERHLEEADALIATAKTDGLLDPKLAPRIKERAAELRGAIAREVEYVRAVREYHELVARTIAALDALESIESDLRR